MAPSELRRRAATVVPVRPAFNQLLSRRISKSTATRSTGLFITSVSIAQSGFSGLNGSMLGPPSPRDARRRFSSRLSSRSLWQSLDRTQVLGDDDDIYGHTGCVNAVSWSEDGQTLVSGGDDRTLCFWRPDASNGQLALRSVIQTGHTANIFSAHFLPRSSLIATCAGDREVRVFDVERARGDVGVRRTSDGRTWEVSRDEPFVRLLNCHRRRVKRIITESPDHFLSVSEDCTVRHHDLRTPHTCREECPQPLVQLPHQLSAIARSSLTPFYFVVAGSSPYVSSYSGVHVNLTVNKGHLFDRRMIPRLLKQEWGVDINDGFAQCVRRFGRKTVPSYEQTNRAHVTGARMSESNGHELLLSYSGDAVHIYSIYDDCQDTSFASSVSHIGAPNLKGQRSSQGIQTHQPTIPNAWDVSRREIAVTSDQAGMDTSSSDDDMTELMLEHEEEDENQDEDEDYDEDYDEFDDLPVDSRTADFDRPGLVFSRMCYKGACNVETVKDVNFLGPSDEFVASGSDDGNWFLWDKRTGQLEGVYEGDSSVVNVIEPHPFLPMVAASGIDNTVKIFSPVADPTSRRYSRMRGSEDIVRSNQERAESVTSAPAIPLSNVILQLNRSRAARGITSEELDRDCLVQ